MEPVKKVTRIICHLFLYFRESGLVGFKNNRSNLGINLLKFLGSQVGSNLVKFSYLHADSWQLFS